MMSRWGREGWGFWDVEVGWCSGAALILSRDRGDDVAELGSYSQRRQIREEMGLLCPEMSMAEMKGSVQTRA